MNKRKYSRKKFKKENSDVEVFILKIDDLERTHRTRYAGISKYCCCEDKCKIRVTQQYGVISINSDCINKKFNVPVISNEVFDIIQDFNEKGFYNINHRDCEFFDYNEINMKTTYIFYLNKKEKTG